jgi:hypothetical protein
LKSVQGFPFNDSNHEGVYRIIFDDVLAKLATKYILNTFFLFRHPGSYNQPKASMGTVCLTIEKKPVLRESLAFLPTF